MELKGVTDSALSLFEIPSVGMNGSRPDDIVFAIIMLFFIGFILLFKNKVSTFSLNIFNLFKSPFGRQFNASPMRFRLRLISAFIIMLPVMAFMFLRLEIKEWSFFSIMLAILAFFIAKTLILYGIGYVSGEKKMFEAITKILYAGFIIGTAVFFLMFAIETLLNMIPGRFYTVSALILLIVFGILYLIEIARIIFSRKLPPFLSILYLCTLEILPLLMIIVTISRI